MKIVHATFIAVTLATLAVLRVPVSVAPALRASALATPASCESLAALALPHARIDSAQSVAQGAFAAPGGRGRGQALNPYADTPAFCRVSASLTPSSDSDIKVSFD